MIDLYNDDCLNVLKNMEDNSVDSIVTDPPYGISFMGKKWDYDLPNIEIWNECFRVLKPGGHLLSFASSRTYHRMAVNIEDAGFEIRDMIEWVYGSGFPKSLNISKAIDKKYGLEREVVGQNETILKKQKKDFERGKRKIVDSFNKGSKDRNNGFKTISADITKPTSKEAEQWEGWGTALKPAHEPICMARKPLSEKTVTDNVLKHNTGAINIDDCRILYDENNKPIPQIEKNKRNIDSKKSMFDGQSLHKSKTEATIGGSSVGRHPANLIHDGSEEVLDMFPQSKSGSMKSNHKSKGNNIYGNFSDKYDQKEIESSNGSSAARFFYCAKANKKERNFGLDLLPEREREKRGNNQATRVCVDCNKTYNDINDHSNCSGDIIYKQCKPLKNTHPTIKPIKLMEYLIKLVTPKHGIVLDPFMGSGTTGMACKKLGFSFIGIEMEKEYFEIAEQRINSIKKKNKLF